MCTVQHPLPFKGFLDEVVLAAAANICWEEDGKSGHHLWLQLKRRRHLSSTFSPPSTGSCGAERRLNPAGFLGDFAAANVDRHGKLYQARVTYLKRDSNVIAKNCNDVLWGADVAAIPRSRAL